MGLRTAATCAIAVAACSSTPTPRAPGSASRTEPSAAQELALTLPPGPNTRRALDELDALANRGGKRAAWLSAHYLLDLFDQARFADDDGARRFLAQLSTGDTEPVRGSADTQAVAEDILVDIDRVLDLDRQHREAQVARTLVRFDADYPDSRAQVYQRMVELRRIAEHDARLGEHARLRLFGYCRQALRDAAASRGRQRRIALSHCLYPLYSSDPEPYFETRRQLRPPPPRLPTILLRMRSLLTRSAPGAHELHLPQARAEQLRWLDAFRARWTQRPFLGRSAEEAGLAQAAHAVPYDDAPVVGGLERKDDEIVDNLKGPLVADGRGTAAVSVAAAEPAARTLRAARLAARAGAHTLELLVGSEQELEVPPGDYWSDPTGHTTVTRLSALPLSLAPLGARSGDDSRELLATGWDPHRAELGLTLVISPDSWRLLAPGGILAKIDTKAEDAQPGQALRRQLAPLRRAFPDEDGLILVPAEGATQAALVAAAEAARNDAQGRSLFASLAISDQAPTPRPGHALMRRIQLRSRARVRVNPEILASRLPIAQRCYLEALEKPGKHSGTIRMEMNAEGHIIFRPRNSRLAMCAERAFAGEMMSRGIRSVEVSYSLLPTSARDDSH
jgi:hypothetical protein